MYSRDLVRRRLRDGTPDGGKARGVVKAHAVLSGVDAEVDPQFAEQRPKLRNLQNEVLTAYLAALDQTMPYDSELAESAEKTVTAVLEMLYRYWTFVRFVKKFARSIWPSFSIPTHPHWRDVESA